MRSLFFFLGVCLFTAQLHAAPGDLDAFDLNITGTEAYVDATVLQPDGKVIIAGHFESVLGVPRHDLARLNPDGTLDLGFDPQPRFGANPNFDYVLGVTVQPDGKVLVGGSFDQLQPNGAENPTARSNIARLNNDGTIDNSFDPGPNGVVNAMLVQADGKILFAGAFTALRPEGTDTPINRQRIARLNADGTLDMDFDPNPNDSVNSMAAQVDGKLVLGGIFTALQPNGATAPIGRRHVARLHPDGTVDSSFDPSANGIIDCVTLQADGKILLGGNFTELQPKNGPIAMTRNHIARLHADGSVDVGFNPSADSRIKSIAVQANGKILLGGFFEAFNSDTGSPIARQFVARLNADGAVEGAFDPKTDGEVFSVGCQDDGKALLAGLFSRLQPNGASAGIIRPYLARLLNEPATQTLSTPDATQILWERGGSAPELSRVTLELSTNGGAKWTSLGAGQRIASSASWQLNGLSLPVNGLVRARGVAPGGYQNGSTGLIEQMTGLGTDSDNDGLLDSWELRYWPTVFGHAATDDFDRDGLSELLEEAFDLDPTLADAASMPRPVVESGYLTITINKHAGITYVVQTAGALLAGQSDSFGAASTTVLVDTATLLKVRDNFLVTAKPRRFMRVQVTAAP